MSERPGTPASPEPPAHLREPLQPRRPGADAPTAPLPIPTLNDTAALAARLAKTLRGGDVLTLAGDLGAGKTTLVQAIGRQWHVDDDLIRSPTFALVHVIELDAFDLVHADLYRMTGPDDVISSGLAELLGASDCVCIIEWPEVARGFLPPDTLELAMRLAGPNGVRDALPNAALAERLSAD